MKKIILLGIVITTIFASATANAQEEPEQGVSLGLQLGSAWNHNVETASPDTLIWTIAPSLNIRTRLTEHSLSYDFVNKKYRIMNAFCIPGAFDIYVNYEQDVTVGCPHGMYGSAGVKKTFTPIPEIELTVFGELGNNLICTSYVRFGLVFQPRFFLSRNYSGRRFAPCPKYYY